MVVMNTGPSSQAARRFVLVSDTQALACRGGGGGGCLLHDGHGRGLLLLLEEGVV